MEALDPGPGLLDGSLRGSDSVGISHARVSLRNTGLRHGFSLLVAH